MNAVGFRFNRTWRSTDFRERTVLFLIPIVPERLSVHEAQEAIRGGMPLRRCQCKLQSLVAEATLICPGINSVPIMTTDLK